MQCRKVGAERVSALCCLQIGGFRTLAWRAAAESSSRSSPMKARQKCVSPQRCQRAGSAPQWRPRVNRWPAPPRARRRLWAPAGRPPIDRRVDPATAPPERGRRREQEVCVSGGPADDAPADRASAAAARLHSNACCSPAGKHGADTSVEEDSSLRVAWPPRKRG